MKSADRLDRAIHRLATYMSLFVGGGLMVALMRDAGSAAYNLAADPYALACLGVYVTSVAALVLVNRLRRRVSSGEVPLDQANLQGALNSLDFGFILTDLTPQIVTANAAAHRLMCGADEHPAASCPSMTLEAFQEILGKRNRLLTVIRAAIKGRRPGGIRAAVIGRDTWRVFVSPIMNGAGEVSGTTVIIQNITTEQALADSKDEFFSIASHELRTPLTAIKGNSALMLQYYADAFKDPDMRNMMDDIHSSSVRLIGIVNDFLDVSRLEQGRFVYKLGEVNLQELAAGTIKDFEGSMQQKQLYLKLDPSLSAVPTVVAGRDRLKQVLFNLIGNAAKFTDTGGITVAVDVSNDTVRVMVTDTGHGITPEMQSRLFHKFQQADQNTLTRDGAKGTGLGLYISRFMISDMGGTLKLMSSQLGKGTTFAFTLPVATPARLKRLAPIDPSAPAVKPAK